MGAAPAPAAVPPITPPGVTPSSAEEEPARKVRHWRCSDALRTSSSRSLAADDSNASEKRSLLWHKGVTVGDERPCGLAPFALAAAHPGVYSVPPLPAGGRSAAGSAGGGAGGWAAVS